MNSATAIDILGVGIAAPGLPDWNALVAVLSHGECPQESALPVTSLLSAREQRRSSATVKLSLAAAEQACTMAGIAPQHAEAVFSSGMGDLDIIDYMCRTLAEQPSLLSPTRFHNSVHNAPAGYWSIGAQATGDITALSGWYDSASVGLIEAVSRAYSNDGTPVLMVVYDDCAKGPMRDLWPAKQPFCAALVLARPDKHRAITRLRVMSVHSPQSLNSLPAVLAERMADNPAARLLPLLALIAGYECAPAILGTEQGMGLSFEIDRS
jgi:hypothetical protein